MVKNNTKQVVQLIKTILLIGLLLSMQVSMLWAHWQQEAAVPRPLQSNIFVGSYLVLLTLQKNLKNDVAFASMTAWQALYLTMLNHQKMHDMEKFACLTGFSEEVQKQFMSEFCSQGLVKDELRDGVRVLCLTPQGQDLVANVERIMEKTMGEINHHFPEDEDLAWYSSIVIGNCSALLFPSDTE